MYAKVEGFRLMFFRMNQTTIRADLYQGVIDAAAADIGLTAQDIGTRIILPATLTNGPRYMQKVCQDAMAIVRTYGKPDLFVTFTCNPKWPEITRALQQQQSASDRPDLCARVFKMKLDLLLSDLCEKHVLGRVIGSVHVVEFQKRGLPHAHILLILAPEDRPHTAADIDAIVSAEIPDPQLHPAAYATVTSSMVVMNASTFLCIMLHQTLYHHLETLYHQLQTFVPRYTNTCIILTYPTCFFAI